MSKNALLPVTCTWADEQQYVLLDTEDLDKVNRWKWHICREDGYARRNRCPDRKLGETKWKTLLMHRVILNVEDEQHDGVCVDHINGNRLDNRKENLRIVSNSENSSNRHVVLSSSGILRVSKSGDRYIARVRKNGSPYYLGSYESKSDAEKAVKLFNTTGRFFKTIKKPRYILQKQTDGTVIGIFSSCIEASLKTDIDATNISRCANRVSNRKSAGGYLWEYIIEPDTCKPNELESVS